MKKRIITNLLALSMFMVTGCANNHNGENTSSSIFDDETMLVASIPKKIKCFNNNYIQIESNGKASFNIKIGYLVNSNDLDYWKSVDNDKNVIYALDFSNGIYRHEDDERRLDNRYELYADSQDYEFLSIKNYTNNFIVYQKTGSNNNEN